MKKSNYLGAVFTVMLALLTSACTVSSNSPETNPVDSSNNNPGTESIDSSNNSPNTESVGFPDNNQTSESPDNDLEPKPDHLYSQGLKYELQQDDTYYITGIGDCTDTNIIIPSQYEGKHVTGIARLAFKGCSNLSSIVVPESVTTIGISAFASCTNLTTITLPSGHYTVKGLFGSAPESLHTVTITGGDHINHSAFSECRNLKTVILPDSITTIGQFAFYRCSSLLSITIPAGVTQIDDSAFYGCSKLVEVINHSSLDIDVGSLAHGHVAATALEVHTEDSKIITHEEYAFYPFNNSYYLADYIGSNTEIVLPSNYDNQNYVIIPGALSGRNITSITVPDSISKINDGAFYGCSDISHLTLPIADGSVYSNLSNLFRLNNSWIHQSTFMTVAITGGTNICKSVFEDNILPIVSITIPEGVTSVEDNAFSECTQLAEIINHSEVEFTIDVDNPYYGATHVNEVHSGSSKIIKDDDYLFYPGKNTYYMIGYMGDDTELILPDSCNGNSYIIDNFAFLECTDLTAITIPESVQHIGFGAFKGCYQLTSITLPDALISIGGWAFDGCRQLASITLPNSVVSIGDYAFAGCDTLTTIEIPDSVISMGDCFACCENLTEIIIGNGVTCIAENTFYDCPNLISVAFGSSITTLEMFSFMDCPNLTTLILPKSLQTIKETAFYNCDALTDIYFTGTAEEWASILIEDCNDPLTSASIHYNHVPET